MAGKKLLLVNSRFPLTNPGGASALLPFSPEQNVALFTAFLQDTVQRFTAANTAAIRVIAANEAEKAAITELLPDSDVRAYEGATMGDVMAEAVEEAFNQGMKQVFLIDSAVPTVPLRIIQSGLSLLEVFEDAFTVAPIERGGFYAVGMNGYHAEVLRGVDPGTQEGYETVIGRICEFDSSVYILQSWYDVRQAEDIVQLRGEIITSFDEERGPEHTRTALEQMPVDSLLSQDIQSEEQ